MVKHGGRVMRPSCCFLFVGAACLLPLMSFRAKRRISGITLKLSNHCLAYCPIALSKRKFYYPKEDESTTQKNESTTQKENSTIQNAKILPKRNFYYPKESELLLLSQRE